MPEIRWRHYAGNKVAPLRRQSTGAFMPETKWLHDAESSQQAAQQQDQKNTSVPANQPQAPLQSQTEFIKAPENQASNGVYVNDQNGCKVWEPAAEPGESVSWSGNCVNGYAEGSGTIVWLINGKPNGDRAELKLLAGKANGEGKMEFHDGSSYTGGFVDGLRSGIGKSTIRGKADCRQEWLKDEPVGKCLSQTQTATKQSPTQTAISNRAAMLEKHEQEQTAEENKRQAKKWLLDDVDLQPALTKATLEVKGLMLGMTTEQVLKIFPQTLFTKTTPNTDDWVAADTIGVVAAHARCRDKDDPTASKAKGLCQAEPFTVMGAHSTRFGHLIQQHPATDSTAIRPGQSERSDASPKARLRG